MSGYAITCALAETFTMGVKAGMDPLALWEAVRQGVGGRRFTFDACSISSCPATTIRRLRAQARHKDVSLATALGRELGVPMRLCNLALRRDDGSVQRGWEGAIRAW